ncbi:glycogen debranching protein GlgX [Ramlibacter albus]|uniref:Glycogen debranching protein GlgX n=1 Tax=Ramlibacter albus TaxID=2079448 RepID=A0A923MEZ2_9BURK|nr:glycogen debranching protein GlgX [Ramlibacter albus]MBC5767777.1 glycogen debranching protein GlgX [Ramlibacter albus]
MTAQAVAERPSAQSPTPTPAAPYGCEAGRPWPMGATVQGGGVNFAVFSSAAERVELCLYEADGTTEIQRIDLPCRSDDVWHGFVPGLKAGARYGLRAHGPYDPGNGLRCNPHKLLLDPYARAIDRVLRGAAWQYAYKLGGEELDLAMDTADNGPEAAKCIVVEENAFEWGDDRSPATPLSESVIYEVHVKGFTKLMPDVPEELRGTYLGLASDAAIAHLKRVGVTAVELLPIHAFNDERRLVDMGLANYWGYNSVAFFAPEPRYAVRDALDEFRQMVKKLHAHGIEVLLDVVYNHSCEGNHLGPTLSFKGLDHQAYYRLAEDRRYCMDFTGTGNTVDSSHPAVLRMVMDSLRYWVEEMHVDGFRFDLAPANGRDGSGAFDHRSPFFSAVAQDPVLKRVKMIAEPWDIGDYGYQVGGFPQGWSEWNGRYRDCVRDFWRGQEGQLPEFASRLVGSSDLYQWARRRPTASVNIITVHDGFTLQDLVSYNEKHNHSNAEDNRDGESHNRSWNCGVEGPTRNPDILALRERQKRNFLATLFASRGVPLLLGGDEMSRTQGGNNNAYCQDNEISWFAWTEQQRSDPLIGFTAAMIRLRNELPVLRCDCWPDGEADADGRRDVGWYSVWGLPMTEEEWTNPAVRCVAVLLDGRFAKVNEQVTPSVLMIFNATPEAVIQTLPEVPGHEGEWALRVLTSEGHFEEAQAQRFGAQDKLELPAHSMALLTQRTEA